MAATYIFVQLNNVDQPIHLGVPLSHTSMHIKMIFNLLMMACANDFIWDKCLIEILLHKIIR